MLNAPLFYLPFFVLVLVAFNIPNTNAAKAPPTNGATMNTHTYFNASPPIITAGAKLLAGLTDVPVK